MIEVAIYELGEEGRSWEMRRAQMAAVPRVNEYLMLDGDEFAYDVKNVLHYPARDGAPPEVRIFVRIAGTFPGP